MYILDTDTILHYFRNSGNIRQTLTRKTASDLYLPVIVLYELETGIAKANLATSKKKTFISALRATLGLIAFNEREALESARIRAELERRGTPIGPYDILIAGTAMAHDATLVTHNTREFNRVKGLQLEDWF